MRKLLLGALLSLGLATQGGVAQAGGYRHHHGHYNSGAVFAAGIVGGTLLGFALSRPRYYYYGPPPAVVYYGPPPPPVYYYPPPPRVVYYAPPPASCYQDNVYRYLPDGSIQWGVRTRCY